MSVDPGDEALDRSASWQDDKADMVGNLAHHFDIDTRSVTDAVEL